MLKSTFKKVSAIAIAGTMLAGMMAVPANAMSSVTKTEKVTTTAISDNFNSYTANTYKGNITATSQAFSENSRITYSNYNTSGGYPGARTLTVAEREDISGDKYMKFDTWVGLNLNINADKTYTVNPGDVVKIKFKYNYKNTSTQKIHVNLNNDDIRYYGIEGGDANGGMHWYDGYKNYVSGKPRIATIGASAAAISDDFWGAISSPAETWNEMEITINTQDSALENRQTLTMKIGEKYLKGYFDANYTGSGDKDYDLLSNINSIQFLSYQMGGANDGDYFAIDDLSITVTGDRQVETGEYVSDLSKTLVDEKFDNLVETTVTKATYTPITGTVLKARKLADSWGGNVSASKTEDGAARFTLGDGETFVRADLGNIPIAPTDEIRVSYDRTRGSSSVQTWITDTEELSPSHKLTAVRGGKSGTDAIDKTADGNCKIRPGGIQRDGAYGGERSMLADTIYHVEYIIKVSDPEYGNKQTVTVKVADDNGQAGNHNGSGKDSAFIETYYLDLDPDTEEVDKFTSLNSFMLKSYYGGEKDVDFDNLKVEVIKPGFEVKDVDNQGNTYTFSGTTPIDLNYLVDASAASKVVIAQYADGGRMISATTEDVDATGAGTVTVTPDANANMIKLMVLDMSTAIPYAKVFKLTKSN